MVSESGDVEKEDVSSGGVVSGSTHRAEQQPVSMLSAQPSFSYMDAMAGFMGVVEAPKAADPALLAEAALSFLDTMWQVCEVCQFTTSYDIGYAPGKLPSICVCPQEQEQDPDAGAADRHKTAYELTAHQLAAQVNVSTIARGKDTYLVICFICRLLVRVQCC